MVLMIVLPSLVNGLTFIKMDINEVEWAPKQVPYYDPFHDTQLVQRIPLDVSYVIEDSLPYFISFSGSGAQTFDRSLSLDDQVDIQTQIDQGMGKESTRFASSGQHQLPYQLYSDENVFFPLKEGGATVLKQDTVNGVLSLDEPSPSRLFFYMSVQPHVVVPPGRYEDIITATLYQGYYDDVSNAMFLHSTQFKVVIHVFEKIGRAHV